ncbi:MAG: pyridoxal-phosphate dependent enzyme [Balneolaceae bacterium]
MASIHSGYTLCCIMCGAENDERETSTYCTACGGVLEIRYEENRREIQYPLNSIVPDPLKNAPSALKKLQRLSGRYEAELFAKLEFEHPTGCFKDRGSYIEVQKALELGAQAICLASTGNMAASVAAYACYFKIPCYVFVPEKTSEARLAQATIYNANILRIKSDFAHCEALCRKFAATGNYYLAGDYVFREEGQKSFSYELIEQGGTDLDVVFIPVGCGTNFGAIYKGMKEMRNAGVIEQIPQLIAVQPEESSPVVEGIFKKEKVVKDQVYSMATSVATSNPIDFYKVLNGIEDTGGKAYTVTENEILDSLREMAVEEGSFTEPASALPLAAFKNNRETYRGKKCLFVLTGSGLKDTRVVAKHALTPPVLQPDLEDVQSYIQSGFIDMQKKAWGKSRETVLANFKLDENHKKLYDRYIDHIHKRGKTLNKTEIEFLQSMVIHEQADLDYPVEVIDYKVTMQKEGLVQAEVKLSVQGQNTTSRHKGVGPVDAILHAIKGKSDHLVPLEIKDHEVEILSPDTDSLVVVTLTLGKDGQEWVSRGASPDTIEAAIHAFEKGVAIAFKAETPGR